MGTFRPVNDAKVSFDKEASELGPRKFASFTILRKTNILHHFALGYLSLKSTPLAGGQAVVEAHYRR